MISVKTASNFRSNQFPSFTSPFSKPARATSSPARRRSSFSSSETSSLRFIARATKRPGLGPRWGSRNGPKLSKRNWPSDRFVSSCGWDSVDLSWSDSAIWLESVHLEPKLYIQERFVNPWPTEICVDSGHNTHVSTVSSPVPGFFRTPTYCTVALLARSSPLHSIFCSHQVKFHRHFLRHGFGLEDHRRFLLKIHLWWKLKSNGAWGFMKFREIWWNLIKFDKF